MQNCLLMLKSMKTFQEDRPYLQPVVYFSQETIIIFEIVTLKDNVRVIWVLAVRGWEKVNGEYL